MEDTNTTEQIENAENAVIEDTETNCIGDESGETNCGEGVIEEPMDDAEVVAGEEDIAEEETTGVPAEWRRDGGEVPMLISTLDDTPEPMSGGLHPAGYLTLGGLSVMLGILISYACFSKCFRVKPAQVFTTAQKFAWGVVVAIVVVALLMVLCYFVPVWAS